MRDITHLNGDILGESADDAKKKMREMMWAMLKGRDVDIDSLARLVITHPEFVKDEDFFELNFLKKIKSLDDYVKILKLAADSDELAFEYMKATVSPTVKLGEAVDYKRLSELLLQAGYAADSKVVRQAEHWMHYGDDIR